jgi:hypothetical protein
MPKSRARIQRADVVATVILLSALGAAPAVAAPLATATISIQFEAWPELVSEIDNSSGESFSSTHVMILAEGNLANCCNSFPTGVGTGDLPGFPYAHHHLGAIAGAGLALGTFTGATPDSVEGRFAIRADYGFSTAFKFFTVGVSIANTVQPGSFFTGDTVEVSRWRAGSAVVTDVTTVTSGGGANTGVTVVRSGFNALTPNGVGTLQLVSPMRITTSEYFGGFFGANTRTAAFSTLTLTFVPEPGTGLLVAAGLLSLAIGQRKARASRR